MSDKCKLDDVEVTPCQLLYDATEYGNPRGKQKGIYNWRLMKMGGGGLSRSFFGAKSGEHVEKGLAFNFCPYCGESIDKPFLAKEETKKG